MDSKTTAIPTERQEPSAEHPLELDFDAVVVGGGFSGLYMLHRLRELGLRTRLYERGSDVGGTWFWNRYPGLQCDTESLSYSFTFSPELYRGWTWSKRFAPQGEILEYARYVADRLALRESIQFDTSVESAHYDAVSNRWTVGLDEGPCVRAKYFITACGPLSAANIPKLAGLESFAGEIYHTGQWPQDREVSFVGKRVAVVGTGSSGVQVICAAAPQAQHLTVLQRTPQYVMPTVQRPLAAAEVDARKDGLEQLVREMRNSSFGAPGASTDRSVHDDPPEERERVLEEAWRKGAQAFPLAAYKDLLLSEEANQVAADFVRRKIAGIVADPETARRLMPDYFFGTKRPVQADGYYETFNRPNVRLVDTRSDPIEAVTPGGIRTASGEHSFDAIVFATGFDAMTGPLFSIDIRGRDGLSLREKWHDGAEVRTQLGVATHGFPNMFMVQGPQSLSVMANFLCGIEVNADWIAGLLDHLLAHGIEVCEATAEAEARWAEHCQALVDETLIPRTESWWTGANIAGKPRPKFFLTFVGGVRRYSEILARVSERGYQGFAMTMAQQPEAAIAAG